MTNSTRMPKADMAEALLDYRVSSRASSPKKESKGDSQRIGSLIQDADWDRRPAWMGKPYSMDLRERVQAAVESGQSRRSAARHYDVSASFAVKLADRVSRTGSVEAARQGRPPGGGKLAPYLTALLEWVEAEPDITMPELAAKLEAEKAVTAHPASLSRVLLKAGLSVKKNTTGQRGRARGRAPGP
jgi:transposase